MLRFFVMLVAIACSIPFGGCPQQIEKVIEESLPPKNYKPVYTTSTTSLGKVLEDARRAAEMRRAGDSVKYSDTSTGVPTNTSGASARQVIAMDVQSVDDSRFPDEVELRAFVYDSSGRFIMGLAPPYFTGQGTYRDYWRTLVDSCAGVASTIDSFEVTEVREAKREPYAVAFVLDHSGSMGNARVRKLREAVFKTLRMIKPGDRVAVIKFTNSLSVEMPLTADSAIYKHGFDIDAEQSGGGTSIYDALIGGVDEVQRAPRGFKKAIILFTDGIDGDSKATVDSVHRLARAQGVNIYTVAYGLANSEVLQNIATYTGGRMYRIYSSKEFQYVFADIYRRFNNYYRISYKPPPCAGVHTVRPTLHLSELSLDLKADGKYDRSIFTAFDPVGQIALVNIEFDYDKATIKAESVPRIQEIADALKTYPKMSMEIRGHTDDRGSDDYNQQLSEDRAQAVADELVKMGVTKSRLTVHGFGESRPLVPNSTEDNRRRNRRTEFVILSR